MAAPPYASGNWIPMRPSSANFERSSGGKLCASSHALTFGRSSASANSRTLRRRSSCSSLSLTSMLIGSYHSVMRLIRSLLAASIVLSAASPAMADATLFIGTTTTPENRAARGFAIGSGLLIVGFAFEYADSKEQVLDNTPSLRTGMGNILLQTPVPIHGFQPYFTTGGGVYREQLGTISETSFGVNTGGGVKISLFGPIRARADYRVFSLRGDPLYSTVHRLYAGVNVKF